ncbi:hypothetical protein MMC15_001519 [Xylographa vitiligo]|nr:hypothetical protein [Xylographa vitiligo]
MENPTHILACLLAQRCVAVTQAIVSNLAFRKKKEKSNQTSEVQMVVGYEGTRSGQVLRERLALAKEKASRRRNKENVRAGVSLRGLRIAGKIMRYCGYNNRTFWENVDEDKDEIWTHLVKDGSSCYAEALPLDLLEQLQDILNEYRDDPLDFDDDLAEAEAPRIFDSDGELEDEVNEYSVGDDSYWGKINGSMDFERRLSLHPFGQNTSIRQAMEQLEGGYLPPPEVQNGGLSPSTATPPPTGLNGPVPFDQAPGAPNANLGTDMPDLTSEPQELEDRPPQWYETRDNDIVSDSSDELGYP